MNTIRLLQLVAIQLTNQKHALETKSTPNAQIEQAVITDLLQGIETAKNQLWETTS